MNKILIRDDDRELCELLKNYVIKENIILSLLKIK